MASRPNSPSRRRPQQADSAVSDGSAAVGDSAPPALPDPDPTEETPVVDTAPAEVFGDEDTDDDGGAAELAARRRASRSQAIPHPETGAVPPGVEDGQPLTVSRTLISAMTVGGSPVRPAGGVWSGKPAVLENVPLAHTGAGEQSDYVVATVDAVESTVLPGCKTPVSRTAWFAGQRVRRDIYEAALAEAAQRRAAGLSGEPVPAELPPGVDQIPAGTVRTEPIPDPAAVAAMPGRVGLEPPQVGPAVVAPADAVVPPVVEPGA